MAKTAGATNKRNPKSKATFTMNSSLLEEARIATREGAADSVNSFVVEAVAEKLMRLRDERRRKLLEEAAKDPMFLADVASVQECFEGTERPPVQRRRRS